MTLKIYACGGTGTNVASQITDLDVDVCYIDTSNSNLKKVDSSQIFLINDLDGGGKDRGLVYGKFKDYVEDVLIRFKPSEQLNVVISSTSGGSGGVLAPLITKELINKGYNTIVIAINSKTSFKEIDNTIKTLKTYQSMSTVSKKCVGIYYVDASSRKEADIAAVRFINLLILMIDKNNTTEFDTADLGNYINFDKVTYNAATTSVIEVNVNDTTLGEKGTNVVSTILVTSNKNSEISTPTPDYLSTCIVTDPGYKNEDIRMDNLIGKLSLIVEDLEALAKEHQDNKRINKFKELEVTPTSSDGMVI